MNASDENKITSLHVATTMLGKVENVKILLEAGASVNVANKDRWTPLHYVCKRGQSICVQLSIEAGAHVNSMNCNGSTPLLLTAMTNLNIIRRLLKFGAYVN